MAVPITGKSNGGERNVAALNLMQITQVLGVEVGELFPSPKRFGNPLKTPLKHNHGMSPANPGPLSSQRPFIAQSLPQWPPQFHQEYWGERNRFS